MTACDTLPSYLQLPGVRQTSIAACLRGALSLHTPAHAAHMPLGADFAYSLTTELCSYETMLPCVEHAMM